MSIPSSGSTPEFSVSDPNLPGFSASTYGDSFADVYDDWYDDISDAGATAAFVATRCGDGPVVELGVGTGRLVNQLIDHGLQVIGLDASADMLSRCAPRPGLAMVRADMAALPFREAGPKLGGALCAFNTLFNLASVDEQAQLFASVASTLLPSGALIIEAITGAGLEDGPSDSVGVSRIDNNRLVLAATKVDAAAQTIVGQHVDITEAGIRLRPWRLRWTTPPQLDAIAGDVGLELVERVADWDGTSFDEQSDRHISVYRPAT